MQIQVRYAGTTKSAVASYEVYADGLRVGFVKVSTSPLWLAVNWVHRPIGEFVNRRTATTAVIRNYKDFRANCTKQRARRFEQHAVKWK
jgi:hypothetical protein